MASPAAATHLCTNRCSGMDEDTIARLVEADEFRTLTILDVVRGELRRGGTVAVPAVRLLGLLRQRLAGTTTAPVTTGGVVRTSSRQKWGIGSGGGGGGMGAAAAAAATKAGEEVVLAAIQLLVEYLHWATAGDTPTPASTPDDNLVLAVLANLPPVLALVARDRVRRAASVLAAAALKRGGPVAGAAVSGYLISCGMESEDEAVRRGALAMAADLCRAGPPDTLDVAALTAAALVCTRDASATVVAAADKLLVRMNASGGAPAPTAPSAAPPGHAAASAVSPAAAAASVASPAAAPPVTSLSSRSIGGGDAATVAAAVVGSSAVPPRLRELAVSGVGVGSSSGPPSGASSPAAAPPAVAAPTTAASMRASVAAAPAGASGSPITVTGAGGLRAFPSRGAGTLAIITAGAHRCRRGDVPSRRCGRGCGSSNSGGSGSCSS